MIIHSILIVYLFQKGTVSGLRYEVFVMISDYEDDFVEEVDV